MKKALVIVLTLVLALSAVALVACSGKTYEGEYSYANPWTPTQKYGCKVKVTVQGNVITKVVVLEDTAEMYNLSAGWTSGGGEMGYDTAGKSNWLKHSQEMIDSFVGLTTKQVLGMKVYVNKTGKIGEPITTDAVETVKYIPEQLAVVIGGHGEIAKNAGATQSSARLILAVQNALLGGKENPNCIAVDMGQTFKGEYKYANTHGSGFYGASVSVSVKDGKITAVTVAEDTADLFNLTSVWTSNYQPDGTPTAGKQNWMDHGAEMANSFVGLSVADVMAIKVKVSESGEPNTSAEDVITGVPTGLIVIQGGVGNIAEGAGATQSSGRLILAIQNALSKMPA